MATLLSVRGGQTGGRLRVQGDAQRGAVSELWRCTLVVQRFSCFSKSLYIFYLIESLLYGYTWAVSADEFLLVHFRIRAWNSKSRICFILVCFSVSRDLFCSCIVRNFLFSLKELHFNFLWGHACSSLFDFFFLHLNILVCIKNQLGDEQQSSN